ncbi:MAG: hypothetical protein R2828_04125 [Saprospiraceae bacterium]
MKGKHSNIFNYLLVAIYFVVGTQFLVQYYEVVPISAISLLYAFYLIKRLFDALGEKLPFKELILSLLGLQMLIAPYLEYYYFHNKVFGIMTVDENTYFSFVLTATLALHLGLNIFYPYNTYEKELFESLKIRSRFNIITGVSLIIIGYIFHLSSNYIPTVLNFVVVSLAFMRFIGFFYLWIAGSKYSKFAFGVVFIPFMILIFRATIFIDLIVFSILITSIYVMKYKVVKWKIVLIAFLGFFSILVLQSVKYSYRNIVWSAEFEGNSGLILADMMYQQITNLNTLDLKTVGANINVRLNQGWILCGILENIPARTPFSQGSYVKKEVLGLLLPRFLYQDKPVVGDRTKFEQFVGYRLGQGVAMNVGIMGDGYGNYGWRGGILFCFIFGLALGYIFKLFYRFAKTYPTLPIWGILIFFYSMRAGNEFYIIGNWIIKTGILVFFYYFLIESNNRISKYLKPKALNPAVA